jgi:uncharacterized membrane protein
MSQRIPEWLVVLATLSLYAALEWAWIASTRAFYERSFRRVQPRWSGSYDVPAVVAAYAVLFAVVYFFIVRADARATWAHAVLLGLGVYGVYNLTNRATLQGYSWAVVAVDTAWGVAAMSAVYFAAKLFRIV